MAAGVVRPDGSFVVEVTADLDALLLGAGPGHLSSELVARVAAMPETEREERIARLERMFERRIRVRFDGAPAELAVSFPDRNDAILGAAADDEASWLGQRARLTGRAPGDWQGMTFFASRAFQEVRWTVAEVASGRSETHQLQAGEESPPFLRAGGSG